MEKQYDNKNRGIFFTVAEKDRGGYVLQGNINVDGTEIKAVIIKSVLPNTQEMYKVFTEFGTLWQNENGKFNGKIGVYNKDTKETEIDLFKPLETNMIGGEKRQNDKGSFLTIDLWNKNQETKTKPDSF